MNYLLRQLQVLFATLGDMRRTPMSSINTVLVVAIALLLPAYLYIGVKTTDQLATTWEGRPQLTLFLLKDIAPDEAQLIFQEVQLNPSVAHAELISPEQGLAEFSLLSATSDQVVDFDEQLAFLGENPLPFSIVLMPKLEYISAEAIKELRILFSAIDGIDSIRLDLEWVERFAAITATIKRFAVILSALLALGLMLIVGNTIKLLIINRRHEIEVTKLVGGSNRFVRRPFLYYGALFGFFGGIMALILLWMSSVAIAPAMTRLAMSYGGNPFLYSFTLQDSGLLVGLGVLLGWLSARWSVAQHIWRIRPR